MSEEARSNKEDAGAPRYRSSAAARMVNIPVATLRVWERRYQVVGPVQTPSGQRLYSSQDVRRLVLIKQLVNRGHAIGMLARMDTASLQDLMDEADQTESVLNGESTLPAALASQASKTSTEDVRVLLVGKDAALHWADVLHGFEGVKLVKAIDGSPASELSLKGVKADVLLADLSALHMDTVDWLLRLQRAVGARQLLVVYGFASTQVTGALHARGAILRRSPVPAVELMQAMMDAARGWRSVARGLRHVPDPAPGPRFDAGALAGLVQAMPRVACECPQHLAHLVTMLGQFEAYSADCESREPADVVLHAYLYRVAGHARALMEEALVTLAQAEGVPLPQAAA
ncbi:MerR family transcriptional regulator [Aquabacterium sp. NJ1]|uniref:MerR family transcriptional regulator n=1 Tax=Aquabacterium sp. NJ1 TaxID=1538295 RepID=UPI0009DE9D62|nr:MerR family transcriptional regulator [Aquabacterium sp. NJ1]